MLKALRTAAKIVAALCVLYLAAALVMNWLSGGNYGFLDGRPSAPSLLDYYSDTWWIYVLQINLTGAVLFLVLLIPWKMARTEATPAPDRTD